MWVILEGCGWQNLFWQLLLVGTFKMCMKLVGLILVNSESLKIVKIVYGTLSLE